jgi:hypothetical protein
MASTVDFSTKKVIKIKVWSPVVKTLLKFEGAEQHSKRISRVTAAKMLGELSLILLGS